MADLHISNATVGALQVSIFLFSFGIGPLFLAPLSELYGRTVIVHVGNTVFVAFSIGSGFAQTVCLLSSLLFSTILTSLRWLNYQFAVSWLDSAARQVRVYSAGFWLISGTFRGG